MNIYIAPSILAADFGKLVAEVAEVIEGGADWIHIDVMDGHFVPNLSMGAIVVDALRKEFSCHLDVHLMVETPERFTDMFIQSGADSVSVHAEATPHIHRALSGIREQGVTAGLALNPGTPLDVVRHVISEVDMLLLMSVNPGFGGQKFIPHTVEKVSLARKLFQELGKPEVPIEIDGGVDAKNIGALAASGANIFVAGSSVFAREKRSDAVRALRQAAMEALA